MRNKHLVKENQARRRLLRFSLFTLGGAGLEGGYLQEAQQEVSAASAKEGRPLAEQG